MSVLDAEVAGVPDALKNVEHLVRTILQYGGVDVGMHRERREEAISLDGRCIGIAAQMEQNAESRTLDRLREAEEVVDARPRAPVVFRPYPKAQLGAESGVFTIAIRDVGELLVGPRSPTPARVYTERLRSENGRGLNVTKGEIVRPRAPSGVVLPRMAAIGVVVGTLQPTSIHLGANDFQRRRLQVGVRVRAKKPVPNVRRVEKVAVPATLEVAEDVHAAVPDVLMERKRSDGHVHNRRLAAYFIVMRHRVSDDQISDYQRNGFLVIENFLDEAELADWRQNVDEAVDQRIHAPKPALTNLTDDEDSYYAQVFLQCIKLADTHAGMRRLLLDPRLGELAAALAGVDGIRIWHDQALIKPPFGNPTGWHLDNPYWSFSSRDSLSIWIALDDATLGNGCMWYLPGSQRTARYENANIGANMADLFRTYPEWREIGTVACPCPAGSAVFHNGLCAHGAGANMTNRQRRAMTCAYMPDGSVFNGQRNVLPEAYFNRLTIGQVLDDPVVNPLVWRR